MKNKVLEAINQFELIKNVNNVTVALSGGADSMSLLYVMVSLRDKLGITVDAAHLNHMIRGAEADRDEEYARSQCKKLGVKFFCERIDVPEYAKEHHMSTELAAREVRYDFLSRVSSGVVATAHTASDNLETMLFNLARGSTLKGLCGIPPKRGKYIRPLLLCTRADVEEYCTEHGISYVTDSTNLCDDYSRNKIRHNVIPVMKEINPSVENTAMRTAISLREDESFLSSLSDRYLSSNIDFDGRLDVKDFDNIAPSVSKRIIRTYFEKQQPDITLDNKHICAIYSICLNGGRESMPNNMSANVSEDKLFVSKNREDSQNRNNYIVELHESVNDLFTKDEKVNNLLLKNSLDCDKIIGKSIIRSRLPGDSIRLVNRSGSKSLKKLYNECHIPTEIRGTLPVISDDKGVIWICGIGVAHRCAVTESSKRILKIKTEKTV